MGYYLLSYFKQMIEPTVFISIYLPHIPIFYKNNKTREHRITDRRTHHCHLVVVLSPPSCHPTIILFIVRLFAPSSTILYFHSQCGSQTTRTLTKCYRIHQSFNAYSSVKMCNSIRVSNCEWADGCVLTYTF